MMQFPRHFFFFFFLMDTSSTNKKINSFLKPQIVNLTEFYIQKTSQFTSQTVQSLSLAVKSLSQPISSPKNRNLFSNCTRKCPLKQIPHTSGRFKG
jgi:hypothetical protein